MEGKKSYITSHIMKNWKINIILARNYININDVTIKFWDEAGVSWMKI